MLIYSVCEQREQKKKKTLTANYQATVGFQGFPCYNLSFLCTSFHWKFPLLTMRMAEDNSLTNSVFLKGKNLLL